MSYLPREILQMIDTNNISLFLTCKYFYQFADLIYRKITVNICDVDTKTAIGGILIIEAPKYPKENVYKLVANSVCLSGYTNLLNLSFAENFNHPLTEEWIIPRTVRYLDCGPSFNQPIPKGAIPPSVTHLTFGRNFNQPLTEGVIPSSITHLTFGRNFNQPIPKGAIPPSVTHLTFGWNFNQPLTEGVIPSSITHLTFGCYFDQPLTEGLIPSSVTHLTFGVQFNQPLAEGVIPQSVTHLTFNFWI